MYCWCCYVGCEYCEHITDVGTADATIIAYDECVDDVICDDVDTVEVCITCDVVVVVGVANGCCCVVVVVTVYAGVDIFFCIDMFVSIIIVGVNMHVVDFVGVVLFVW